MLEAIRSQLPELPDARQQRFIDQYGLTPYDAARLTADRDLDLGDLDRQRRRR